MGCMVATNCEVATKREQALKIQPYSNRRHLGSEQAVCDLTGFSKRTLQKDRVLGRKRFPWYKVGGKVLYDLDEVEKIISDSRRGGGDIAA